MPVNTVSTEDLINQLWLPIVKEAKTIMYPRRRKNARMKLLTLTDGIEPKEIYALEQNDLIERSDAVAWVKGMQKRARIEAESVGCVLDGSVYNRSFVEDSCPLNTHFPFDVINLDFFSQDPLKETGRIESEVQKTEKIIALQQNNGCKQFVLIYTTLIDNHPLNISTIIQNSDSVAIEGWDGLNLSQSGNAINSCEDKRSVLSDFVEQMAEKYGYSVKGTIQCFPQQPLNGHDQSFSIGVIMVK